MLEPLMKTRLYENIVNQFMDMIRTGELKPGDKLPTERELAAQLNVSRTAIREALRSMELMGLIDSKVGSGTYIREMTLDKLLDSFASVLTTNDRMNIEMLEVRLLLEVEIARRAARKNGEGHIAALEKSISIMEDEIRKGKLGLEGDNAFHTELAKAADNLAMISLLGLCDELLASTRKAALKALPDPKIGLMQHREILEAVRGGDVEKAGSLMRNHLETAYVNLEHKGKTEN
ncbi:MAG: FadR/GntR family transcriptional regulator [Clostridia bacterium]|nr:FadR/GntR family transcriptional regulator [Clostridia bacterium]MDR3643893.1 FadR/GntR family transcriptional regulator [Clostridia bacterium]